MLKALKQKLKQEVAETPMLALKRYKLQHGNGSPGEIPTLAFCKHILAG